MAFRGTILLLLLASLAGAADLASEAKHAQQRISERWRLLELRLLELAASLEAGEPEQATRLRLALSQARDQLLLDRMTRIDDCLSTGDYQQARLLQSAVLQQLGDLQELLLSDDLDFRLRLQRLRGLREAQRTCRQVAGRAHKLATGDESAATLAAARDELTHQLSALAVSAAQANQPAAAVTGPLRQALATLTADEQGQTIALLQAVAAQLQPALTAFAEQISALLEVLRYDVRQRAITKLSAMQRLQRELRVQTGLTDSPGSARLAHLESQQDSAVAALQLARQTAQLRSLCEEVGVSRVLPTALAFVERMQVAAVAPLAAGEGGDREADRLLTIETAMEQLLTDIEALPPLPPATAIAGCESCGGEHRRRTLIAELRLLRTAQMLVREDARISAGGPETMLALSREQEQLQLLLQDLTVALQ